MPDNRQRTCVMTAIQLDLEKPHQVNQYDQAQKECVCVHTCVEGAHIYVHASLSFPIVSMLLISCTGSNISWVNELQKRNLCVCVWVCVCDKCSRCLTCCVSTPNCHRAIWLQW